MYFCGIFGDEVREDVIYESRSKKKTFLVSFQPEKCEITCSCHFLEFQGILCGHAITVLIRHDVKVLPDKYILRRWRRDVSRAHMRVDMNYDGLVSTLGQLMYEKLCTSFALLADLATDDVVRATTLLEWIEDQCKEIMTSKSSSGSNVVSLHMT